MKKLLLTAFILSFLIFSGMSQAVEVKVEPSHVKTYVKERAYYTVEIYNNQNRKDQFIITVSGQHLEWLNLESYFQELEAYERNTFGMYFYPLEENMHKYEILVYSPIFPDNKDTETFSLKVFPERFVWMTDFSYMHSGNSMEITLDLSTKQPLEVDIFYEVFDSEGQRVKYLETTEVIDGDVQVEESLPLGDLLAGDYSLRFSIPEYEISEEMAFSVAVVHNVLKKKEIISTPFGEEIIITITNMGNVAEDYNIRENIPTNEYVDVLDEPSSSFLKDDEVSYNWRVEGLITGESTSIRYGISNIPKIAGSLIIVIAILGLLGMGTIKVRTPNIKKLHKRKGREHVIVLEIRGSLTKGLRNVLVKDRVSPLGKVPPEFEGPKPIVREGEAGTELIWRLGDIKPRSEIYLTYRVRPLIEAQLKMPRAYLSYRTDDDKKIRVFSKQVLLE